MDDVSVVDAMEIGLSESDSSPFSSWWGRGELAFYCRLSAVLLPEPAPANVRVGVELQPPLLNDRPRGISPYDAV